MSRAKKHAKDHEEESIVALFLGGYLPHEIAEDLDVSKRRVSGVLGRRGYSQRFSYEGEQIDEWVAYYTGDMTGEPWSVNRIARHYGRAWGTVAVRVAERVGRLRHPSKFPTKREKKA